MNAHLDYLRLASWDYTAYPYTLTKIMGAWPGDYKPGKWLQYSGWRKEQFFMGHGQQMGERHMVLSASGSLAERMRDSLAKCDGWYATRIDLQMTVPRPDFCDLHTLHNTIGHDKTTLISSEENDTLYFGSRESDRFVRLYEKPMGKMYLRLEFELKGNLARGVWEAISLGDSVGSIFGHFLKKLRLPKQYKELYVDAELDITDKALRAEITRDNQKTLKWIRSLDACMMRHMNNHEIGDQVMEIIRAWSSYSATIDNPHNLP